MTAFNLAVCIAPSILWPPTSSSPELENEFTKKVMTFFILCPESSVPHFETFEIHSVLKHSFFNSLSRLPCVGLLTFLSW